MPRVTGIDPNPGLQAAFAYGEKQCPTQPAALRNWLGEISKQAALECLDALTPEMVAHAHAKAACAAIMALPDMPDTIEREHGFKVDGYNAALAAVRSILAQHGITKDS
jgi:hypothetical protein